MVVVGCPAINNVRKRSLYKYVKSSLASICIKVYLAILSVQSLSIKLNQLILFILPFPKVHVSIFSTFSFFCY